MLSPANREVAVGRAPVGACVSPIPNTMRTCWINGAFVSEDSATVSIFDRGLLFGDGVYEVCAVLQGRVLDADLHLARLARSLDAIGITDTISADAWRTVLQTLAEQNAIDEGLVYLQITRGVAERDFPFPAATMPTMFAYARPKALTTDAHAAGVRVHTVADWRWTRRDIKSTSMLAQVLAKQEARAAGAYEALLHEDGVITEGGASTFWMVQGGVIITRPLSHKILAGVTRTVTLALAASLGLTVRERAFRIEEACAATECFLSSATGFVLPVTHIDNMAVGDGAPGPIAIRLRAAHFARAATLFRDTTL